MPSRNVHPNIFERVMRATNVSRQNLCKEMMSAMNARGLFDLEDQQLLAPQLTENVATANAAARNADEDQNHDALK